MKHRIAFIVVIILLFGVVLAETTTLYNYYTDIDWFASDKAASVMIPENLTEREAEIYRMGYAHGHYDGRNPEYVIGLFVLNTKTKKYHLSNCSNTLMIAIDNRDHSVLSPEELKDKDYKPCGMCHPDTTYSNEWLKIYPEELKQYQEWFYREWYPQHQEWIEQNHQ